jgi:hypothetical protein
MEALPSLASHIEQLNRMDLLCDSTLGKYKLAARKTRTMKKGIRR